MAVTEQYVPLNLEGDMLDVYVTCSDMMKVIRNSYEAKTELKLSSEILRLKK